LKNLHFSILLCIALSFVSVAPSADRPRGKKEMELRLEPKAGLPEQTVHFTIEAYGSRSAKAAQLLESTYLDFIDTTGLANFSLPRKIRVLIFENQKEFRSKTKGSGDKLITKNGALITFEQDKIDGILAANVAGLMFDEYMGRKPATEERWLRRGIVEAVVARRGGTDVQASRDHWRKLVKRDRPATMAQMLGKESREPEVVNRAVPSTDQRRAHGGGPRHLQASSASLVTFLGTWGGRLNLAYLLSELRAQRTLDQALAKAYPGKFRNFEELYNFWLVDEIGEFGSKDVKAPKEIKTPGRIRK
jgi:hypothetical protein